MQSFLFLNGCILFAIGGGLGLPFWVKLIRAPTEANAWRVAHSAITLGGTGVVALSAAYDMIQLSAPFEMVMIGGVLVTGYGFGASTVVGAITGRRGLVWKKGTDAAVFTLMVSGTLGSLTSGPLLIYGAYNNWTRPCAPVSAEPSEPPCGTPSTASAT